MDRRTRSRTRIVSPYDQVKLDLRARKASVNGKTAHPLTAFLSVRK